MGDLTFGELFAGVGGFSVGFEQAGWVCRWQVEWDRHCQQVLARHWPEVARYGDVRNVAGGHVPLAGRADDGLRGGRDIAGIDGEKDTRSVLAPVTCVTFGSPCQDLSVAGKRAGLDGARSGLFFEAIRIIREMRDATAGTLPRFAIWENVAGALSSNKGADFLAVLDAFAEVGAVDIAWRLVDAQHFGVPQRRRRVFVVADFGGECAGAIHVEPAGVRWHSASGGTAGEDVAGGVACGLGADSRIAGPLGSNAVGGHRGDLDNAGAYVVQEVVGTLSAGAHPGGFNGQDAYNGHLIMQPIPVQDGRDIDKRQNGLGIGQEGDPMYTIDQTGSQSVVQPSESRATVLAFAQNQRGEVVESECHHALTSGGGKPGDGYAAARIGSTVRRLTPLECERLNGFPDHHTRWRADGLEQSDSQRYRQMGNAVAVPCAAWLAFNLRTALETQCDT